MKVRSSQRPNFTPTCGICAVAVNPSDWCKRIEALFCDSIPATIHVFAAEPGFVDEPAEQFSPQPFSLVGRMDID
ncbi:Uncharacterised protein [Salmonella bongori]|nr:Uncharacterised protein [Salmonella bongori]